MHGRAPVTGAGAVEAQDALGQKCEGIQCPQPGDQPDIQRGRRHHRRLHHQVAGLGRSLRNLMAGLELQIFPGGRRLDRLGRRAFRRDGRVAGGVGNGGFGPWNRSEGGNGSRRFAGRFDGGGRRIEERMGHQYGWVKPWQARTAAPRMAWDGSGSAAGLPVELANGFFSETNFGKRLCARIR